MISQILHWEHETRRKGIEFIFAAVVQQSVSQMGDFDHSESPPKALAEGGLMGCCEIVS